MSQKDILMLRSALTAVQSAFDEDNVLVIELVNDDVRVFVRRHYGRVKIDTGSGLEANLLEAAEIVRAPQQG